MIRYKLFKNILNMRLILKIGLCNNMYNYFKNKIKQMI